MFMLRHIPEISVRECKWSVRECLVNTCKWSFHLQVKCGKKIEETNINYRLGNKKKKTTP